MFMLTLGRTGIKRLGTALLCAAVLSGTLFAVNRITKGSAAAPAAAEAEVKIATTQDIATYFRGYGLEVDLTSASIDEVKIPKKWDDAFASFHETVKESGGDLTRYKGKTVEKWTILCPGRSSGADQVYGVLLVAKKKPIGGYLLTQPSGEVTGLETVAGTAAPLEEAETAAGADFGEAAETGAAPAGEEAAEVSAEAAGAEPVE